jgi:hypothetical protein
MRQSDLRHLESVDTNETARGTAAPAAPTTTTSGTTPLTTVPLGAGRSLQVQSIGEDRTLLHVRGGHNRNLEIEIRFDAGGPVVKVVAPVLELEGMHEVVASCDTFKVDARERIELRSGGELVHHAAGTARLEGGRVELDASPGAIRLNANDEVQLLGEMILLNCDHPSMATPMPSWAAGPRVARPEVSPEATSGDASVIAELLGK